MGLRIDLCGRMLGYRSLSCRADRGGHSYGPDRPGVRPAPKPLFETPGNRAISGMLSGTDAPEE